MKTRWFILGAVVVGGLALMASSASAEPASKEDDKPDPKGGEMEVRHGIAHDGCSHFELRDPDAIESFARSNAMAFAKYLGSLDAIREDPEPAMVDFFALLFPECQWPPAGSTTFGPERETWAQAIARAKSVMADQFPRSPQAAAAVFFNAFKATIGGAA